MAALGLSAWGRGLAAGLRRPLVRSALGGAVLLSLLALVWAVVLRASAQEVPGKLLYTRYCVACHGEQGDRLPVAPLQSREFLDQRQDVALLAAVRDGKGVMPGWSKDWGGPLDDSQIVGVLAYVNDLAQRRSPLSLAPQGSKLYRQHCAACHGEQGDRIPAAPLNAEAFLASKTDAALLMSMERGKGMMLPQGKEEGGALSRTDIEAVVAFLRCRLDEQKAVLVGRGRAIYAQQCLGCHGEKGDKFPAGVLTSPTFLEDRGDSLLRLAIAQGKAAMPAFSAAQGGPLFSGDIEAVLLFLKSWAGLPPTVSAGGVGVAAEVREWYARDCAPCHGEKGDKIEGTPLMAKGFLERRGERALVEAVRKGTSRGMPAWGKEFGGSFLEDQIRAIIQFLIASAGASQWAPPPAVSTGPAAAPAERGAASGAPIVSAPSSGAPPSSAASKGPDATTKGGDAGVGARLFAQSCVACHGQDRNAMPTAKLGDAAWLQQRGDEALMNSIANGKGAMPAWGKAKGGALSEEDITAIVAYLKQTTGGGASPPGPPEGGAVAQPAPKPPPRTEPVVITERTGQELFMKICAMCHGEDGMRQSTAPLGLRRYLSGMGFDRLVLRISSGRPTAGMPAWSEENGGPLAPEEIKAIVEYLLRSAPE